MSPKDFPALSILNRIAFALARKSYRVGLLFTLKNDDFGVISLTERSSADLESGLSPLQIPGSRKKDWNLGVTSRI